MPPQHSNPELRRLTASFSGVSSGDPNASAAELSCFQSGRIRRLQILRTSGAGNFTARIYKNSAFEDADVALEVDAVGGSLVDVQPIGGAYYTNTMNQFKLWLVVIPQSGGNNDFTAEVHVEDLEQG